MQNICVGLIGFNSISLQYFSKFSLRWSQQESFALSYIHFILQAPCITAASLIQYFFLVTFSWMLIEGIQLYHKVTKVTPVQLNMPLCYVLSYGKGITCLTDKFSARVLLGVLSYSIRTKQQQSCSRQRRPSEN